MLVLTLLFGLRPLARGQGSNEFPVFVWRSQAPGKPLPEKLVQAFGGVNVEGADEAQWARERGLDFYVGHGPGRDALHIDTDRDWYAKLWQEYWDERDPSRLVRVPCLSQESTREQLRSQLARTLKAREGDHGLGISLGDEVGLTPYGAPLDLCVSEACRSGFEAFLRAHPRWSFLLPEAGAQLPYPDTDITRKAWIEGDPRHVGAWLARRAYHHTLFTDLLKDLARQVKAAGSEIPVGLFGQSGRSAFADVGVEEIFDELDFMEVYRLLDSRELLCTRRRNGQRSYLTLFPQADAPHGPASGAFEHWMRGGDGLVLWSDRELLEQPQFYERMSNVVGTLRTLRYAWPEWAPQPERVAVLHSPDSLALNWLRDALHDGPTWMRRFAGYQVEHGTREVSLRAVLRLLEDSGVLPGALPIAEVGEATGQRFPLLVANELILLEPEELARIQKHLANGHRLLVVGDFGLYDRRGKRRAEDLFAQLQEAFPKGVSRFPLDAKRYLAERFQGSSSYPQRLRAGLKGELPANPAPAWHLEVRGQAADLPWLRVCQAGEPQAEGRQASWLCAALPNAATDAERTQLQDLTIELKLEPRWRVDWVHPPAALASPGDPFVLPAGEALVFRLWRQ